MDCRINYKRLIFLKYVEYLQYSMQLYGKISIEVIVTEKICMEFRENDVYK